jgi:hypothetical protein
MKSNTVLSLLAVGTTLALGTLSAQAAPAYHHIASAELDALHAGDSRDQVIQTLGKPQSAPKWLDGSSSLVYELKTGDGDQFAYVNLDSTGKIDSVQVITNDND